MPKKYFFTGYNKLAKRAGDLYVCRENDRWQINAGVDSCGHDPGFGVVSYIVDGSAESLDHAAFCKETASCQSFIVDELEATPEECKEVFEKIWEYIHNSRSV